VVRAATRHTDGANYSFADGHVKFLKAPNIANVNNPALTGLNYMVTVRSARRGRQRAVKPFRFSYSIL